jgi:hypothetical protein
MSNAINSTPNCHAQLPGQYFASIDKVESTVKYDYDVFYSCGLHSPIRTPYLHALPDPTSSSLPPL